MVFKEKCEKLLNHIFIRMGMTFVDIPRIKVFYASNLAVKTEASNVGKKRVQNHFQKKKIFNFTAKTLSARIASKPRVRAGQGSEFRSNDEIRNIV